MTTDKGDILVVDDQPNNLRILSTMLSSKGYHVRTVLNGELALSVAQVNPPDLILLDINMPRINGYKVCSSLKNLERTRDIPVIFLSALDGVLDKVKAFSVGGVDFISKPFQLAEVLARIENQLTLRRLQLQLEEQNEQLQEQIHERAIAEQKYRSIFENAVEGLFQMTPDGQYISANPALAQIYGYNSPDDLIACLVNGNHLYVNDQRWTEFLGLMQARGSVFNFHSQIYRKDGKIIWISENVHAVRDPDGNLLYYEGSVVDITERKVWEQSLREEQERSERLLLNILPKPIAQRLKVEETTIADSFEEVTVMFADLVDFTTLSARTSSTELVEILNVIFSDFDQLTKHHGLEKIKTIGDAYMAVSWLAQSQSPSCLGCS